MILRATPRLPSRLREEPGSDGLSAQGEVRVPWAVNDYFAVYLEAVSPIAGCEGISSRGFMRR
jgi:hypothetical protein